LLFDCFLGAAGNKKTTVWAIWCSRNKVIFSNGVIDPGEVVDKIKVLGPRQADCAYSALPCCCFPGFVFIFLVYWLF
jgi:hypothetical protein